MSGSSPHDDDAVLRAFGVEVTVERPCPFDAHVIGEPVRITAIRYDGPPRLGLRATCQRGERAYDVSLADVVLPPGHPGAAVLARYRAWLGLDVAAPVDRADIGAITVGQPVELVVLACKTNALRCRPLGGGREVTLRTAVRDQIPGVIITVTPRKQWTHARHPYLSGDVEVVRIDAAALGLVPLALRREGGGEGDLGGGRVGPRPAFQLEQVMAGALDDPEADEVDLLNILASDVRCLAVHAHLGDHAFSVWPLLALRHYELAVAIASLSVGPDFDGVLPWGLVDNRPFLRCLHGLGRARVRLGQRAAGAEALRRLLRLDPSDPLRARAGLDDLER